MSYQQSNDNTLHQFAQRSSEYANILVVFCILPYIFTICLFVGIFSYDFLLISLAILLGLAVVGVSLFMYFKFYQLMNSLENVANKTQEHNLCEAHKNLKDAFIMLIIYTAAPVTIIPGIFFLIYFNRFTENLKSWADPYGINGPSNIQVGVFVTIFVQIVGIILMIVGYKELSNGIKERFHSDEQYITQTVYQHYSYSTSKNQPTPAKEENKVLPIKCPSCGKSTPKSSKFCTYCGASILK